MNQSNQRKDNRKPLKCPYTGRLLAEISEDGETIYLLCKGCKHAHAIPIAQLLAQISQEVTQTA